MDLQLICEYCKKKYSTKSSLKRHYMTCKVLKTNNEDDNNNERINKLTQLLQKYSIASTASFISNLYT